MIVTYQLVANTPEKAFTTDNPFELSLYVDFQRFVDQMEEPKYIPAKIKYSNDAGDVVTKKVKVKARGAFRRKSCEIPPIRINFNDEDYEVELFNELGKVKLVNECDFGQPYQEYLVKEYLTYKSYEQLTDFSFRTWFLHIKFIDTADTTNNFSSYSFLIEDVDDLADRHGMTEVEIENLNHSQLNSESESLVMLFNYMIGNLDLFLENLHNLKLLRDTSDPSAKPVIIPYDFDFSGLVNAEYASPPENISVETVRDRFYLGECRTKQEYHDLFQLFISKKPGIYELFNNTDLLSQTTQSDAIAYLEEFYQIIERQKAAKKQLINKCW